MIAPSPVARYRDNRWLEMVGHRLGLARTSGVVNLNAYKHERHAIVPRLVEYISIDTRLKRMLLLQALRRLCWRATGLIIKHERFGGTRGIGAEHVDCTLRIHAKGFAELIQPQ